MEKNNFNAKRFLFSFSSHSRCEIKRAGEEKKRNFCRDLKEPGSNLACAPFVVSFPFVFQLQDGLKSYGRGDENWEKEFLILIFGLRPTRCPTLSGLTRHTYAFSQSGKACRVLEPFFCVCSTCGKKRNSLKSVIFLCRPAFHMHVEATGAGGNRCLEMHFTFRSISPKDTRAFSSALCVAVWDSPQSL